MNNHKGENINNAPPSNASPMESAALRVRDLLQKQKIQEYDVAIDGDAGSGKDTLGNRLAELLHVLFVNSGDFYRSVAVHLAPLVTLPEQERVQAVHKMIQHNELRLTAKYYQKRIHLKVNDIDVTDQILLNSTSNIVFHFSQIHEVRDLINMSIQKFAEDWNIVMGGRDIGLVVLPRSLFHIQLTASPEIRAKRRFDELETRKATTESGGLREQYTYESILESINRRDEKDAHTIREIKKALPPKHPTPTHRIVVDTDMLDADEVLLNVLEQMAVCLS